MSAFAGMQSSQPSYVKIVEQKKQPNREQKKKPVEQDFYYFEGIIEKFKSELTRPLI